MVKLLTKLDLSAFNKSLYDSTYLLNQDKKLIESFMNSTSILDINTFNDEANIYEYEGKVFWIDREGIIDYITELINK